MHCIVGSFNLGELGLEKSLNLMCKPVWGSLLVSGGSLVTQEALLPGATDAREYKTQVITRTQESAILLKDAKALDGRL